VASSRSANFFYGLITLKDQSHIVLVTGATGAVGPLVVEAFHDLGYRVRTLSIDLPPMGAWPVDVEICNGDVTDASAVRAAMKGVDSVIHLAALLHHTNPPPALEDEYERVNVGGASTVVAAAIQSGVKRFVFFSTIAVYGQSAGRILSEDMIPYPNTFYARTKLAAEKIVLEAKSAGGVQIGVVLRFGAVYGSRVKGNYQRLVRSLARGRFIPIGNGSNLRSLIFDKDVARAAVLASEHPEAVGKIYNVSDGGFHSMDDIISIVCQALDRLPPRLSLPVGPVRFAAGVVEDLSRMMHLQAPITRSTIDKYIENTVVDSKRFQNELGFVPQYDLLSGWRETVREMQASGSL
jgi:nucleoside-diphosphate-sugar epimerase